MSETKFVPAEVAPTEASGLNLEDFVTQHDI